MGKRGAVAIEKGEEGVGAEAVGASSTRSWPVAGNCLLRTQRPHLTGILEWTPENALVFWVSTAIVRYARQAGTWGRNYGLQSSSFYL